MEPGKNNDQDSVDIATDNIIRQFKHGQTYQAHPMVCAAALEVQRIILEENLMANAQATGKLLESELRAAFGDHPYVGSIRGRGLFWAVSVLLLITATITTFYTVRDRDH